MGPEALHGFCARSRKGRPGEGRRRSRGERKREGRTHEICSEGSPPLLVSLEAWCPPFCIDGRHGHCVTRARKTCRSGASESKGKKTHIGSMHSSRVTRLSSFDSQIIVSDGFYLPPSRSCGSSPHCISVYEYVSMNESLSLDECVCMHGHV